MNRITFIWILLLAVLTGCTPVPSVEEAIEKELGKRIEKLKKQKRKDCKEFIKFEAETMVDSIMYLEMGSGLPKSLPVPERPFRPDDSMAYSVELDTTNIESFLPDTLQLDSLGKD